MRELPIADDGVGAEIDLEGPKVAAVFLSHGVEETVAELGDGSVAGFDGEYGEFVATHATDDVGAAEGVAKDVSDGGEGFVALLMPETSLVF